MFSKGDLNRIWLVLGAIDSLELATWVAITNVTKMPKSSVKDVLNKLIEGQVAGVVVEKQGTIYKIIKWNDFRQSVAKIFKNNT
ncbi:MAG: hypothetical protein HRU24_13315 [Gammaproteobacteria bacterium]|nr:hypothetical protein [Gammaproteobacteria bacterium]